MTSKLPPKHILTYGTLMFPEVMHALLAKNFESELFTLYNYNRYTLKGKIYPGLFFTAGTSVPTRLYFNLDDESLDILDGFEDAIYERTLLDVSSARYGSIEVLAYTISESLKDHLTEEVWCPEKFSSTHLERYLERCNAFRQRKLNGQELWPTSET